ncbi:MAG: DUF1573 domain-containing protein [Phycisphaeraceae bacterium]|nr:MAG: DUF1573 domain-containing protein [Phycisphaeraceae bacterium]
MHSISVSGCGNPVTNREVVCEAPSHSPPRSRRAAFGILFVILTLGAAFVAFSVTSAVARRAGQDMSTPGLGLTSMAPLRIEPERVDLGLVAAGSTNRQSVTLRNTSRRPIRITSVSSTCTCTAAEVPSELIPPGATTEIEVRMRAHRKAGRINERTLSFFVDGWKEPVRVVVRCESAKASDA